MVYQSGRSRSAAAQFNLGVIHEQGLGVAQNMEEAPDGSETRRNKVADAQFNLGVMYEHGQGVTQDSGNAAQW